MFLEKGCCDLWQVPLLQWWVLSPVATFGSFESELFFDLIQATVYERFLGKTLQELNRMAGIFRPFTRAKSREALRRKRVMFAISMVPQKKGGIGDIYIYI